MKRRTDDLHGRAPAHIMRAGEADNDTLIREIVAAAALAVDRVRWPRGLDRARAPEIVHAYLSDHSRYQEENELQIIRLPRALVVTGVHDCKSSAVFAYAMLRAAGYRVRLRFIRQPARPWWSHVYAVADGVAVDPLLPLGHEAPQTARMDYE